MIELIYTDHLKLRLSIRKIPDSYPRKIYEKPEQKFADASEGNLIAIKKLLYGNKIRNMMIAYEEEGSKVEIITIHPISEEKIVSRVLSGRWVKI
jgi:hypothetical protein